MYIQQTVEVEVDIDLEEILDELTIQEKRKILDKLYDECQYNIDIKNNIVQHLQKIIHHSWRLSIEDEAIIANIANKL